MRGSLQNNRQQKLEILSHNNSACHCTNQTKSNLHLRSHRAPINAFKLLPVCANDDAIAVSNGIRDAAHICQHRHKKTRFAAFGKSSFFRSLQSTTVQQLARPHYGLFIEMVMANAYQSSMVTTNNTLKTLTQAVCWLDFVL
jgi:hypothetical protein